MGKGVSLSIILLLLTILFPISTLTSGNNPLGKNVFIGAEYEITFEQDITYEDWANLEDEGLVPLRQVSKNKILIWTEKNIFNYNIDLNPNNLLLMEKNEEVFLPRFIDLHEEVKLSKYRVLLEPHLPANGVFQVISILKEFDLVFDEPLEIKVVGSMPLSLDVYGNIPSNIEIDGVWKIEEIKETSGRNDVAGSIIESGDLDQHNLWEKGLNGEGILIGVADTGIDLDHACFRENQTEIGIPGDDHRKIKLINSSIDSWDSQNNSDYGHGTHIAGSLSCNWTSGELNEGTSLSFNSKLLVQDIVSEDGWLPPENVEVLFLEAAQNGAVIHSDSWGDNEVNYTERSGRFDGWGREVPWSLIFVAPGNSGGQLMEPANARNVVAVGSTTKSEALELVSHSSVGPTNLGTRGIFLVAPGKNIISAKSDGIPDSMNGDTKSLTGTSMATPIAASGAAIIQQMVEEGLFQTQINSDEDDGFTPSGPLMKALLSLATTSITDSNSPDPIQGWGVLNISELVGIEYLEQENATINDVWIWDSYQFEGDWSTFTNSRIEEGVSPLDSLTSNSWNGEGARGPFLSTGDQIRWNFTIQEGEDLKARLSWLAKPEPYIVDDLQLSILTSDGRIAYSNNFDEDGNSILYNLEEEFSSDNETTVGINLNSEDLEGVEWVHVIVNGNYVSIGNSPNTIGIEGNRVGFGLVVKGIQTEENIILEGGEIIDFEINNVLGYTFLGTGGDFEQIIFEDATNLVWNFSNKPGHLNLDLAINVSKNLSLNLSKNPFGFKHILGLGEKAVMPICSNEEEDVVAINPSSRRWLVERIWWPPPLTDCKENKINFNLSPNDLTEINPLTKLGNWIENNRETAFIQVEINLSSLLINWGDEDGGPNQLNCNYRFENKNWSSCDLLNLETILIPKDSTLFEIKWEWIENDVLEREYIIQYEIPVKVNEGKEDFNVDYLTEGQNQLVLIGENVTKIPIVLLSEDNQHAFVKLVDNNWDLNEISMNCGLEKYYVMSLDYEKSGNYIIGGNAIVVNESDLLISSIKLNLSWDEKVIIGEIIYLELENKEDGHIISLPLKNIDLLELQGDCNEIGAKSSNLALEGVFLMWLLLSIIMLVSGLVIGKKQQLLQSEEYDEES